MACKKSKRKCSLCDDSNSPVRGRKAGKTSKIEERDEENEETDEVLEIDGGGGSDVGADEPMGTLLGHLL